MDNKEEPIKHKFVLPSFIIKVMLWASRCLVYIKLFNSGEPIINIGLMIALYYIMEICILFLLSFIHYFIHYFSQMMKNPDFFINMNQDKIKELLDNDFDFINLHNGIITILYIFLYFN